MLLHFPPFLARSAALPYVLRHLYPVDKQAALEFCEENPIDTVFIRQNIEQVGLALSGAVGLFQKPDNKLVGLLWESGMAIPVGFPEAGLNLLAEHLHRHRDKVTSFVGPREQVMGLWGRLENEWGQAADIRAPQYSMLIDCEPAIAPDEEVRLADMKEGKLVFPVAVAAFKEEVGYDPSTYGNSYMLRTRSLIRHGRTYIKLGEDVDGQPRVIFKADIGALAGGVAQIQGVWTVPDMRGQGIASAGLSAVIRHLHGDSTINHITLYVNHYNTPALRVYEKLGFRHLSDWATVQL